MDIIRVDPERPDQDIINHAASIIREGGLVAFPTETVYGLGADSANRAALRRLFKAKGRPESKPVLALIAEVSWLDDLTGPVSENVRVLMEAFWPGPLTLTFPAASHIAPELLGGGTTLGVRYPGAFIAQTLTRTVGRPITAPSANRSGHPSPLSALDVARDMDDRIDLILDGGEASDASPSTLVDVSGPVPQLIRAGRIPFENVLALWRGSSAE
jgi:L-threonylcarbamoyladenylate synthase